MTGAILAGGLSSRMGVNKAFIKINDETIIGRTLRIFREEFDDVFIVANDLLPFESLGVRVVADIIKGAGSLGGVYTALFHAETEFTFVAACDMPCLDAGAIKKVISRPEGHQAVTPFIDGKYHPMHALYSRKCRKPIKAMINEGNLRITDLFDKIHTMRLKEEDFKGLPIAASVENVNTREDLARLTERN